MLSVSVRKINLLGVFFLLAGGISFAQSTHHFDYRPFNLGFSMGLNINSFKMTHQINTADPNTGEVVNSVSLENKPGLYLGLLTSFKLHNNIDFRFTPNVTLEEREIIFHFNDGNLDGETMVRKNVEAANLNIPFLLKFKSNYYQRVRVYCMLGLQASWNLANSEKVRNDKDLIKTELFDWGGVASFGIDLYGEKLKLNPEIRYTLGFRNIYVDDPRLTRFVTAVSSLHTQTLAFILNFE